MNVNEMCATRAKLIKDAQALLPTDNTVEMTAEVRTKFDAMMDQSDVMKADIERVQRSEKLSAELREVQPIEKSAAVSTPEVRAAEKAEKHKAAFSKWLKLGMNNISAEERSIMQEHRALAEATGSAGGFTLPSGFVYSLEQAMKYFGGIRPNATILTTDTGNPLPWPSVNDVTNVGARLGVGGTATEVDPVFGQTMLGAWTYTSKYVTVPNELLNDSAFDLESFLRDAFVERLGRIQNTEFSVYGGTNGPQGLVPYAVAGGAGVTAATGGTATVTYSQLVDLTHAIDIAYRKNAKFMFHDAFLQVVRKLVDTLGRPLLSPGIDGGTPDTILGIKYILNNDIAVPAASAVSALYGDFSKYIVRDVRNSMAIRRLDEIQALSNATIFLAFMRSDARGLAIGVNPVATFTQSAT